MKTMKNEVKKMKPLMKSLLIFSIGLLTSISIFNFWNGEYSDGVTNILYSGVLLWSIYSSRLYDNRYKQVAEQWRSIGTLDCLTAIEKGKQKEDIANEALETLKSIEKH